jgi:hypothetical protein
LEQGRNYQVKLKLGSVRAFLLNSFKLDIINHGIEGVKNTLSCSGNFEISMIRFCRIVQMSEAAWEDGTNRPHERLYQEVVAGEPGYFYIYLSNDSPLSVATTRTHGLPTGKKVKNLETGEFYITAIYYDDKGRVIQTLSQQQLGGTVRSSTAYNFEGQSTHSLTANSSAAGKEVLRTYTYNVAGSLASMKHKIGTVEKTLVNYTYNDLGQMLSKSFPEIANGNQTYTYNIRGWLKTLGSSLATGYKQTNYYETGGTANNWNGNISQVTPTPKSIELLKRLSAERDLIVKDLAKFKSQLKQEVGFFEKEYFLEKKKRVEKLMKANEKVLKEVEYQIDQILDLDSELKKNLDRITAVEGVGRQTAVATLVATENFTKFTDPKKFACHSGCAPFRYESGTSRRSAHRVSHKADKNLKRIFHMAAVSTLTQKGELRQYYDRKVAEGKKKMSVINAIRAKLIARIFAIINQSREYEKNYIHPLA